jgi:hypothetical protein
LSALERAASSQRQISPDRAEKATGACRVIPGRPSGTPDGLGAVGALLTGADGGFLTGSDIVMDGGVTASYWYGDVA